MWHTTSSEHQMRQHHRHQLRVSATWRRRAILALAIVSALNCGVAIAQSSNQQADRSSSQDQGVQDTRQINSTSRPASSLADTNGGRREAATQRSSATPNSSASSMDTSRYDASQSSGQMSESRPAY